MLLVVLVVAGAGLVVAATVKTGRDAITAGGATAPTPAPLEARTSIPGGVDVVVIGDGGVTQAVPGVPASARWPALLDSALSGTVSSAGAVGAGYAVRGGSGRTFGDLVPGIGADADVVVFFGGAADSTASTLSQVKAATSAIGAASTRAPNAQVLVVGPVVEGGLSSARITSVRNGLRSAAAITSAIWIDPISSQWLPATSRSAASVTDLNAKDERTIALRMRSEIERLRS